MNVVTVTAAIKALMIIAIFIIGMMISVIIGTVVRVIASFRLIPSLIVVAIAANRHHYQHLQQRPYYHAHSCQMQQ